MGERRGAFPGVFTVCLTGGVASGKSAVARLFAALGATVLDADATVRELYEDAAVVDEVAALLGPEARAAGGGIDRQAVARLVFGDEARRRALNAIVHPKVLARMAEQLRALASGAPPAGPAPVAVLDVPLASEVGLAAACDLVVFVDASDAARAERACARGWDAAELARREATQTPLAEKRAAADAVVPNSGPIEQAAAAVRSIWDRGIAPALRPRGA